MFEKKQTGESPSDDKDKTSLPEQKEEKEEAAMKRGGAHHHKRKHGGHVPGHKSEHRPDRRARGGGAEHHPETSAGNMSTMDYEKDPRSNRDEEGMGKGADKTAKGF